MNFHVMKNKILPTWENEENKNSSFYSIKINTKITSDKNSYTCISESLLFLQQTGTDYR